MNWLNKLKSGLQKTSSSITSGITKLFTHKKLDTEILTHFEELLLSSDIGVKATAVIIDELTKQKFNKSISADEVKAFLREQIATALQAVAKPLVIRCNEHQPYVILVCGINGSGKTTTIGKLAYMLQQKKYSVMLVACDTFRAAAIEQLQIWAQVANNCPIIFSEGKNDPASIAHLGLTQAKQNKSDILLIDTAGRLHNNVDLMNELSKCVKVLKKIDANAPQEVILVLDGTIGQNAYAQIEAFSRVTKITGLIITKLDSTAKGGVVIGIAQKYNIPIYAVGIGEEITNLHNFTPEEFAEALIN
ncbi:Signal recognition particle receptor FtsY [Alphaproteobacteria bacterium]